QVRRMYTTATESKRFVHDRNSLIFFSSRRRHTRSKRDWSSDVCSSDLPCRQKILGKPPRKWRPPTRRRWIKRQRMHHRPPGRSRSEERRVGKEWRSRRTAYDNRKKENAGQESRQEDRDRQEQWQQRVTQ